MTFDELVRKIRKNDPTWKAPSRLLALDPGETIGWALFEENAPTKAGHLATVTEKKESISAPTIMSLFNQLEPTQLVVEDYRVYAHKTDSHSWSGLHTPRLIGMIELLAYQRNIPLTFQMASTAKGFCTTDKLKSWGFYRKGHRHAMDAIRHGAFYLLFDKRKRGGRV